MVTPFTTATRHTRVILSVLETGERLPILVDADTWLPPRIALRWSMINRRFGTQSSTLAAELRMLGRLYTWAWNVGHFDLDSFLVEGHLLSTFQIQAFAAYLREHCHRNNSFNECDTNTYNESSFSVESYDRHLSVVKHFLIWALYAEHRGGIPTLGMDQTAAARVHLSYLFDALRIGAHSSHRIEPLSLEQIAAIRQVIQPQQGRDGRWIFPTHMFSRATAIRNWVMVEVLLELGIRRGELLKLRLDSLPRGRDDLITIKRYPDDRHDSRRREPAVKTAERKLPASRQLLSAIKIYLTTPSPYGRVADNTPYLFTSRTGVALSATSADEIFQKIGQVSGVIPLSPHRFRHTWAEAWAEANYETPQALTKLMYLGG